MIPWPSAGTVESLAKGSAMNMSTARKKVRTSIRIPLV